MGAALSSSEDEFIPNSSPHTDDFGRAAGRWRAFGSICSAGFHTVGTWRRTVRPQSAVVSWLLFPPRHDGGFVRDEPGPGREGPELRRLLKLLKVTH